MKKVDRRKQRASFMPFVGEVADRAARKSLGDSAEPLIVGFRKPRLIARQEGRFGD
jgi:hypothetical protein